MSSSQAVNINSFINAIVTRLQYITGSSLSSSHKTQITELLKNGNDGTRILNVKTAISIMNKLRRIGGKTENFTMNNASNYASHAVSVNTALQILNNENLTGQNYKFTYLNLHHNTNTGNSYNGSNYYRVLQSGTIGGTLIGGGSGGRGAWSYSTGKNGNNNTVNVGASGAGESSSIVVRNISTSTSTTHATANGASGVSKLSFKSTAGSASTTYVGGSNGVDGNSNVGTTINTINVSPKYSSGKYNAFYISCGAGGGGSGGVSFTADGAAGLTVTSPDVSGSNGGAAGQTNSWTGHATTWASGGGGGAPSGSTNSTVSSTVNSSYNPGTTINATNASSSASGRPTSTSLTGQPAAATTLGAGGKAGLACSWGHQGSYGAQDGGGSSLVATGGSGGMRGGFKVSSGGDLLLIVIDGFSSLKEL